ncbi:MAG TPA: hypothetical protein VKA53_11290 [Thermoanaerobaculia bacterium]|nr:hypothetical protein [Thermoanaerobaculia bacterium]
MAWLLAAVALVSVASLHAIRSRLPSAAIHARNPLQRTQPVSARRLAFLERIDFRLPSGSSVVVYSEKPQEGMRLFMLALAALPDHPVRPYWYFGVKHSESLTDSEFLISTGCSRPTGLARWKVVARDDGDCLARIAAKPEPAEQPAEHQPR